MVPVAATNVTQETVSKRNAMEESAGDRSKDLTTDENTGTILNLLPTGEAPWIVVDEGAIPKALGDRSTLVVTPAVDQDSDQGPVIGIPDRAGREADLTHRLVLPHHHRFLATMTRFLQIVMNQHFQKTREQCLFLSW